MKPIREWMGDKRVAAVLAVVAILFVAYRLVGSGIGSDPAVPETAIAPPPSTAVQEPAPTSAASLPPPSSVPIPPGWTGPAWSWNRNPFLGPAAEGPLAGRPARNGNGDASAFLRAEGAPPELRGTVVSGSAAMAIFGNRLIPVGGKVGDWTLFRVEPYRIFLRRGNETRVLELYKQ
jgi:hypothetical protein